MPVGRALRDSRVALDHAHAVSGRKQLIRGGDAADSAADDDYIHDSCVARRRETCEFCADSVVWRGSRALQERRGPPRWKQARGVCPMKARHDSAKRAIPGRARHRPEALPIREKPGPQALHRVRKKSATIAPLAVSGCRTGEFREHAGGIGGRLRLAARPFRDTSRVIIRVCLWPHAASVAGYVCKPRTAHRRHRRTVPMAHFSCFPGASALSDFRQTRLLETLARIDANIVGVRGQYLHFVNSAEPLSDEETSRIHALMHYGAPFEEQKERGNVETFMVVFRASARSRRGPARRPTSRTTAAWRISADRARRRIHVHMKSGLLGGAKKLSDARVQAVAALLHDRMTETVLRSAR